MPYTVQFGNGRSATFQNPPSQRDIREAAMSVGADPATASTGGPQQQSSGGGVSGFVKAVADPFVDTAAHLIKGGQGVWNGLQAGASYLGGDKAGAMRNINEANRAMDYDRQIDFGPLGTGDGLRDSREAVARGLEIGSWFIGGGAAKGAAKGVFSGKVGAGIMGGARAGSVAGAAQGAGQALKDPSAGIPQVAMSTAMGSLVGGAGGAIVGAAVPALVAGVANTEGALQKIIGSVSKSMGEKIQNTVIRPTARDISNGFSIENLAKYDVGGSLGQSFVKVGQEMSKRTAQLREVLASKPGVHVNLNDVLERTAMRLTGDKKNLARNFMDNPYIEKTLETMAEEIDRVVPGGLADLPTSQLLKQASGLRGAWSYGIPDRTARAEETVFNTFYNELKMAIETAAEETGDNVVKRINTELSELIPIRDAIVRRLPVAERNNAISLTDAIGLYSAVFDPKALVLMGLNRMSKSGRVGDALVKGGQKLIDSAPRIPLIMRP